MRVIVKFSVFFAFLTLFVGCSDDSGTSANYDDNGSGSEIRSSGSTAHSGSGSVQMVQKDTINGTSGNFYYSEGIFCWTDGCEKDFSSASAKPVLSSSSKPKSSASTGTSTGNSSSSKAVSSSSVPMAEVNGDEMMDPRDGETYAVEMVGEKLWMAENLRYTTATGMYCKASDPKAEDQCGKYGGYYIFSTAKNVCPGGWRLPTKAEFQAVIKEKDFTDNLDWWTLGGRFKKNGTLLEFGQDKTIGYIWLQEDSDGKMSVQFQKDRYEYLDQADRGYNVRCVKN